MAPPDLLLKLAKRIEESRGQLARWDRYYEGRPPTLAYGSSKYRKAFGATVASLSSNWVRLFTDILAERLVVTGFRFGGNEAADSEVWNTIWQPQNMDEKSAFGILDALVSGRSYFTVWADGQRNPLISVESPQQMTVAFNPGTRERVAALKLWREEDRAYATLYTSTEITKWASASKVADGIPVAGTGWVQRDEPIANVLGVVPVVPCINRSRTLDLDGESELAGLIPMQDLANKLIADICIGAEAFALPRRWVTGVGELPTDPETGQPMRPFGSESDVVDTLFAAEGEQTRFGQFPEASLDALLSSLEMAVTHMASQASVPAHLALGAYKGQMTSAESIRAAEAGLVMRAKRRQLAFSPCFEEVVRLSLLVRDGQLPEGAEGLECVWAEPATISPASAADAALKSKEIGLPWQARMEAMGHSPQAVERLRVMLRQEAADAASIDLAGMFGGPR